MNSYLDFDATAIARALAPSIPGIAAAIAVAADQLVLAEIGTDATIFDRDTARQAIIYALSDYFEMVDHDRHEPYPTLLYTQLTPFHLLAYFRGSAK